MKRKGTVVQVTGPVVDVAFDGGSLPEINEALSVAPDGQPRMMEVAQHIGGDDWVKIARASGVLAGLNIYVDDNPAITVAEIKAKCRRLGDELGLIVIDYLQLMHVGGRHMDNRVQEVAEISRSLKIMAKELNVPVVCLSQLSRASEQRSDKRPMLSDLRESGAIEQDADIVMFIYRDDYYDDESENKNIAEIIIAKNRHGATGTIELQWVGQYTTFSNPDRIHEE